MKRVGYILIAVGLAALAFSLFIYLRSSQDLISPVPESGGVKVIYVTPDSDK